MIKKISLSIMVGLLASFHTTAIISGPQDGSKSPTNFGNDFSIAGKSGNFRCYVSNKIDEKASLVVKQPDGKYINIVLPQKKDLAHVRSSISTVINTAPLSVHIDSHGKDKNTIIKDNIVVESERHGRPETIDKEKKVIAIKTENKKIIKPSKIIIKDEQANNVFKEKFKKDGTLGNKIKSLFKKNIIKVFGIKIEFKKRKKK
ncbi:hypothetical protein ACFLYA_00940 [Candidatus Dependentiae bacterium]